jgi:hypothetical protein
MSNAFQSVLLVVVTGVIAAIVIALVKRDLGRGRKSRTDDGTSDRSTPK